MKDSQLRNDIHNPDRKYIKVNNERFSTNAHGRVNGF